MTVDRPDEGTTALIYARVSTDDKDQTVETQLRICREFCQKQGMEILEEYTDEVSGSTLDRPGFARMMNRILFDEDADFVVAYDQSRITRGEDFEKIAKTMKAHRCRIRLVKMDLDTETLPGKIVQDIMSRVNTEENKIRNEKTRLGMQTRKYAGYHVGRPAKFMFAEDIADAPKGRFHEGVTVVASEDYIYSFARKGYSLSYVAKRVLSVDVDTLKREMTPCTGEVTCSRAKGRKDRITTYRALLEEAKKGLGGGYEGSPLQRVGKTDDSELQRVVS